jgi:RimJ/RimL family protein N-acetyltransferase
MLVPLPEQAKDVCRSMVELYTAVGFVPPWIGYLATAGSNVVGTCAFKGPKENGRVEIAYFTFPAFEGQGIATAMARSLIDIAFSHAPDVLVVAQTAPEKNASTTILGKLGFTFVGGIQHPEDGLVWEWQYRHPDHALEG